MNFNQKLKKPQMSIPPFKILEKKEAKINELKNTSHMRNILHHGPPTPIFLAFYHFQDLVF